MDKSGMEIDASELHERVRLASTSELFPDSEWLRSIGFVVYETRRAIYATIVVDNHDKTSKAHVDLRLTWHDANACEWMTHVMSYDENNVIESAVGLVASGCKTRAQVVRLCKALNVHLWRGAIDPFHVDWKSEKVKQLETLRELSQSKVNHDYWRGQRDAYTNAISVVTQNP